MFINGYYINCYLWLFINDCWWLFCYKPLMIILLMVIDGHFINGY